MSGKVDREGGVVMALNTCNHTNNLGSDEAAPPAA